MGNLYTHIVKRKNDPRIEILSFLKQAWRTKPRDYEYINRLKEELRKIDKKSVKPALSTEKQYKKKYGAFWKKAIENQTKPKGLLLGGKRKAT